MESLVIQAKTVGPVKNPNCKFTFVQRIWGLLIEVMNVIAEFISCDPFELTENVINNNHQIKAVKMAFDRLDIT